MDNDTKKQIERRIASAAGHLKGIERMVAQDSYCIDVIQQVQAVQAALNKINNLLLDNHLHTCLATAISDDDAAQREQMLTELSTVFTAKSKL